MTTDIGIIGGGQLALMMGEAARRLGLRVRVLVREPDEPATTVATSATVGDATDLDDLRRFAAMCDVLTFDHELVDPVVLAELEDDGVVVRPRAAAIAVAVDKYRQIRLFRSLGLPIPDTRVVDGVTDAIAAVADLDGAAVLKAATGGYDGRGVLFDVDPESIRRWYPTASTTVLVQRAVPIDAELAIQVVRGVDGTLVHYPVVRTVQRDGMCATVEVPSGLPPTMEERARTISAMIAEAIGVVGVLAVEFLLSEGSLLLNELAARPHNSGHLTIEAAATSQFENHIRAVAGLPLGPTDLLVPAAAMANVVGRVASDPPHGVAPDGTVVHLYGKDARPGRKLGHVTAIAGTVEDAIERAVHTARLVETGEVAS